MNCLVFFERKSVQTPPYRAYRAYHAYFPALESPIAGLSSLPRLSSLSSHISTSGPKRGEDLKENEALPMAPKGQKGSNFIEFYKNRRRTENLGTCYLNLRSLQCVSIFQCLNQGVHSVHLAIFVGIQKRNFMKTGECGASRVCFHRVTR
jgi:hypothetical protein